MLLLHLIGYCVKSGILGLESSIECCKCSHKYTEFQICLRGKTALIAIRRVFCVWLRISKCLLSDSYSTPLNSPPLVPSPIFTYNCYIDQRHNYNLLRWSAVLVASEMMLEVDDGMMVVLCE